MHEFVRAMARRPVKDRCTQQGLDRDSYDIHRLVPTWRSVDGHTCHLASSGVHISKLLHASKSSKESYWWGLRWKLLKAYSVGACEPRFVNCALGSIKGQDHPPNKIHKFSLKRGPSKPYWLLGFFSHIQAQAFTSLSSPKLIQALLRQHSNTHTH
jgi:hypothetical protein